MKVKIITDYHDTVLKKLVKEGKELEVADARGEVLINSRVAVAIPTTPEVDTKSAPKKRASKKKEA